MRKFEVTTEKGYEVIAQLKDKTARKIAVENECMVYELKKPHDNPVMR